ncbi:hypothetical protein QFC22_003991 [Naganishia vaughanmartiniae]|uniref:Uncharacterized protein n=1 Tax=Naganishia vaughanmartiniae TaxID=1424756 RepID=A0ACC2X465_9TREE|nr:hypothetical protein QFC22_003991 [Naganishia vaughanmartiniae]
MVRNKKGKGARNSNGTFGSTKKASAPLETTPIIRTSSPAPSENPLDSADIASLPEAEPVLVFFDDPEDADYVYDEADMDEEDKIRKVQAVEQMEALNLQWKSVTKKRFRGRGRKLFENPHQRTVQRRARDLKARMTRGYSPPKSTLKQTSFGSYFTPKYAATITNVSPMAPSNMKDSPSGSDIIIIDHDEVKMDEEESGLDEEEDIIPEESGLSQLESEVVMTWVQSQEGTNAAGGGEELAFELEMDELADRDPELEEEADENNEEENPESTEDTEGEEAKGPADMNKDPNNALEREGS